MSLSEKAQQHKNSIDFLLKEAEDAYQTLVQSGDSELSALENRELPDIDMSIVKVNALRQDLTQAETPSSPVIESSPIQPLPEAPETFDHQQIEHDLYEVMRYIATPVVNSWVHKRMADIAAPHMDDWINGNMAEITTPKIDDWITHEMGNIARDAMLDILREMATQPEA